MANSNFPMQGNSSFGIDSYNSWQLNIFNPYSLYHYTVMIVSPLFPEAPSDEIKRPEVSFQDLIDWCGQFIDIDNEEHPLYVLATLLIDIAKEMVDHTLVGPKMYVRAVSYYAAHYLELHIKMLKEEKEQSNFDVDNVEKEKEIKIEPLMNSKEDFRQTVAGSMFWSIYGNISRFAGGQKDKVWGAF